MVAHRKHKKRLGAVLGAPPRRWWGRSHRDLRRGKEKVKERGAWGGLNTGGQRSTGVRTRQTTRGGGRKRDEKEKKKTNRTVA